MKTLLIVDDDEALRRATLRLLQKDFEAQEAEDGLSALTLLRSGFRPDLIISDLNMPPGMGGLKFIEILKSEFPNAPPVILYATDPYLKESAESLGVLCCPKGEGSKDLRALARKAAESL